MKGPLSEGLHKFAQKYKLEIPEDVHYKGGKPLLCIPSVREVHASRCLHIIFSKCLFARCIHASLLLIHLVHESFSEYIAKDMGARLGKEYGGRRRKTQECQEDTKVDPDIKTAGANKVDSRVGDNLTCAAIVLVINLVINLVFGCL